MYLYATPLVPIPSPQIAHAFLHCFPNTHPKAQDPPLSSLYAYALLSYARNAHFPSDNKATLSFSPKGKPYLEDSSLHLSLSHSKTHALCAISNFPIGCDIESHREVSHKTMARTLSPNETQEDFFAYWCLKESYVKLSQDFSTPFSVLDFSLENQTAQYSSFFGKVYDLIPNNTVAVLAKKAFSPPKLQLLGSETLFSHLLEKYT